MRDKSERWDVARFLMVAALWAAVVGGAIIMVVEAVVDVRTQTVPVRE